MLTKFHGLGLAFVLLLSSLPCAAQDEAPAENTEAPAVVAADQAEAESDPAQAPVGRRLPTAASSRVLPLQGTYLSVLLKVEGDKDPVAVIGNKEATFARGLEALNKMEIVGESMKSVRPNDLARVLGLPAGLDATPVVIEAGAQASLVTFLQLVSFITSVGPPYFVNVFLKTREGCIGIPVLFLRKGKAGRVDDNRPYQWYFFCDGQIVGYDWDPAPPANSAPQSISQFKLSPVGSGRFLVSMSRGVFDLIPSFAAVTEPASYAVMTPVAALRADYWGSQKMPMEAKGEWLSLSQAQEDLQGRMIIDPAERRRPATFPPDAWKAVGSLNEAEEVLSGMVGEDRAVSFANPVLRYVLYRNGPAQTVQNFADVLVLAKRYGLKGVFTILPRKSEAR